MRYTIFASLILFIAVACSSENNENVEDDITDELTENTEFVKDDYGNTVEGKIDVDLPSSIKKDIVACQSIGNVDLTYNEEKLLKSFGKSNVLHDTLFEDGKLSGYRTTLWPNTKDEIMIHWTDKSMNKIQYLLIRENASDYKSEEGIKVGISLEKLYAINDADITFWGLGWDDGGKVLNLNNGILKQKYPCIELVLGMKDNEEIPDDLLGSVELKASENKDFLKKVVVTQIKFDFSN